MLVRPRCATAAAVRVLLGAAALLGAASAPTAAQAVSHPASVAATQVGSRTEQYLRYLQALGLTSAGQWTVRGFGPREMDRMIAGIDTSHAAAFAATALRGRRGGAIVVTPFALDASYNTTYPFGDNDGPAWRGRGLTAAVQGGVAFRAGPLTVALQPIGFWAENRAFAVMPNRAPEPLRFGDALNPGLIDRPQRFGERSYARLDPGESTIRLDAGPVAAGISTAAQWFGPMSEWPFILGNNSGGFPHFFAGTAAPVNVFVGRLHGRVFYGDLRQSGFSDVAPPADRRFASGLAISFLPAGLPGIEVGGSRFFHQQWPSPGLTLGNFGKPFEDFFKRNVGRGEASDATSTENQLASFFARWVVPGSGLELYGELGREDHSFDERDALLSPDHQSTFGFGLRKAWRASDGSITGARFELLDLDPSILGRQRAEGGKYLHTQTRQGHTQRGQLLGAGFASDNGAGTMIALERLRPNGEGDALSLRRLVVREPRTFDPARVDVQYALAGERTRNIGQLRVTSGLTAVYELSRYFAADVGNLMGSVRIIW